MTREGERERRERMQRRGGRRDGVREREAG